LRFLKRLSAVALLRPFDQLREIAGKTGELLERNFS
jgi:hypothetical protein